MPLQKSVLSKYVKNTFVETGTYQGETVALALELGFKDIWSVDCNADYARACKARYPGNPRVTVNAGDSPDFLQAILPRIKGDITFWLDAHPLVTPMPLFSVQFPLLRELLTIIRYLGPGKHVLMIDDLRTFSAADLSELERCVKELWPDSDVSKQVGIQDNDVLVVELK